jgi:hypothetical protein
MKRILLVLALVTGISKAEAQLEYMHSAGVGYYSSYLDKYPAIQYWPRLNLLQMGWNGTISLDTRISLGYYAEKGTYAEEDYFTSLIPATINWNMKNGNTRFATEKTGFYIGAGAAIHLGWGNYSTYGPYATGGIRFDIGDLPFDLNAGALLDVTGNKSSQINFSINYMLNTYQ